MPEITFGSVWKHTVTGNVFRVKHPNPETARETAEAYIDDPSEPFVYVETPDYETRETAYLGRRLFDSQLEQVEP